MDATAYPHLLASISHFAASHYTTSHDHSTALALRATCRTLRDIVDRRLFEHVAYKDGEFLTPSLHSLPSMYPTGFSLVAHAVALAESRNLCACCQRRAGITWDEARGLVRMLDLYSELPGGEVFTFPNLATVRCAEPCWVPPPAQTVLMRIQTYEEFRSLTIPAGTRRCAIRWHPLPTSDVFNHLLRPPSLEELVVVVPRIDWREAIRVAGFGYHILTTDEAREESMVREALKDILSEYVGCEWVERGGRVTFVISNMPRPKWDFAATWALHNVIHEHLALSRYGWSGKWEDLFSIRLSPEDQKLKDNIKVITSEAWGSTATDLEREWLEREGSERRRG